MKKGNREKKKFPKIGAHAETVLQVSFSIVLGYGIYIAAFLASLDTYELTSVLDKVCIMFDRLSACLIISVTGALGIDLLEKRDAKRK